MYIFNTWQQREGDPFLQHLSAHGIKLKQLQAAHFCMLVACVAIGVLLGQYVVAKNHILYPAKATTSSLLTAMVPPKLPTSTNSTLDCKQKRVSCMDGTPATRYQLTVFSYVRVLLSRHRCAQVAPSDHTPWPPNCSPSPDAYQFLLKYDEQGDDKTS